MIMKIPILFIFCFVLASSLLTRQAPPFNQTLSRQYIVYAIVVGCPAKCVQSWTCKATKQLPPLAAVKIISSEVTRARVYIGYDTLNKQILISWRGSVNARNWIEDFNFETQAYQCSGCRIHSGFHFDYRSLEKKLKEATNSFISKYEVTKILITGHSMGAALSVINGIEFMLAYGMNININVHNFGCPRIGNHELAKYIHERVPVIQRVVHNKDIVPHLPPEQFGYWHTAYEIFFDAKMDSYQICNDSGEDKSCSDKFSPDFNPADHDFYYYNLADTQC